ILALKNQLLTLALLVSTLGFSQSSKPQFSVIADSLIKVNHKAFNDLDYAIYRNKYDTLKMKIFAERSAKKNYPQGEAFAHIMLGNQYRNKSLFKKSKAALNKNLTISKEKKLIELQIVSLSMLGVVERRLDNIKSGLAYHQNALQRAEQHPEKTKGSQRSIAVSYNSVGNIYLSLKQYDLALQVFNVALKLEREAEY